MCISGDKLARRQNGRAPPRESVFISGPTHAWQRPQADIALETTDPTSRLKPRRRAPAAQVARLPSRLRHPQASCAGTTYFGSSPTDVSPRWPCIRSAAAQQLLVVMDTHPPCTHWSEEVSPVTLRVKHQAGPGCTTFARHARSGHGIDLLAWLERVRPHCSISNERSGVPSGVLPSIQVHQRQHDTNRHQAIADEPAAAKHGARYHRCECKTR